MKISELIKTLGVKKEGVPDFKVSGISCNSKQVSDNFVFVAIKGNRANGNKFIEEAIGNGAKAIVHGPCSLLPCRQARSNSQGKNKNKVLCIAVKNPRIALAKMFAEFYGNPSSRMKVVGITGTNGKTTITYLLEAILRQAGKEPAVIGTVNYRFKSKIIPAINTTPGPQEIQPMLSAMLAEGVDYCLMEVSSHALDQDRVEGVDFHSAIFTNLTQDHLDYHKTFGRYFLSKSRLFIGLSSDSFAVLNYDDEYGRKLKKLIKGRLICYGVKRNAPFLARDIETDCMGSSFTLFYPGGKIRLKSRLIGTHNIYNLLAACAWSINEGVKIEVIRKTIEKFDLVPGRLERVDVESDFSVFVDYAHTEDALFNIIRSLRKICEKRVIVVFGCGGNRDKTKRPKMGRVVSQFSDFSIITNDNPRGEEPVDIFRDIAKGMKRPNYCIIPERENAIKMSLALAKTGDIVLIAGKGHENYQIIKETRIPFDDRQVVRECLRSGNY